MKLSVWQQCFIAGCGVLGALSGLALAGNASGTLEGNGLALGGLALGMVGGFVLTNLYRSKTR
jgi:hypothetical protein